LDEVLKIFLRSSKSTHETYSKIEVLIIFPEVLKIYSQTICQSYRRRRLKGGEISCESHNYFKCKHGGRQESAIQQIQELQDPIRELIEDKRELVEDRIRGAEEEFP